MDKHIAEIDYDTAAELTLGANFPETNAMETELLLIDMKTEDTETEDELSPQELQKSSRITCDCNENQRNDRQ